MSCSPLDFPDGLSDFGQLLELWTRTAHAMLLADGTSKDSVPVDGAAWVKREMPKAVALANYTLRMRRNATANCTKGSVQYGLIWGPAEHDTCHFPDYYFSTSMWAWRGMVDFSNWLNTTSLIMSATIASNKVHNNTRPAAAVPSEQRLLRELRDLQPFAVELANEASAFAADISRALRISINSSSVAPPARSCNVAAVGCGDTFNLSSGYIVDHSGHTGADERGFTIPANVTSMDAAAAICEDHCRAWAECTSFVLNMNSQQGSYSHKCYTRRCEGTEVQRIVNVTTGLRSGCHAGPRPKTVFVPVVAAEGVVPYQTMVESRRASYSNFRWVFLSRILMLLPDLSEHAFLCVLSYYPEMVSSGFMSNTDTLALLHYREGHSGTLSGMTRFQDHLDDMPAAGYARADVALDRVANFNLLVSGFRAHMFAQIYIQFLTHICLTTSSSGTLRTISRGALTMPRSRSHCTVLPQGISAITTQWRSTT
jgi:hypothetical protein